MKIISDEHQEEQTIESLKETVTSYPQDEDSWNELGNALLDLERYEEAIEAYNRAIKICPDFSDALYNRGLCFYRLNRFVEAMDSFTTAIEAYPQDRDYWYMLGLSQHGLSNSEKTLETWKRMDKIDSGYMIADYWHAFGEGLSRGEQYEESICAYIRALELEPKSAEVWIDLATSLKKLEKYEDAIDVYIRALEINPKRSKTWIGFGHCFEWLENIEQALLCYRKVLRLEPDNEPMWLWLGKAFDRLGADEDAFSAYKEVPDEIDSGRWKKFGSMLYKLKRYEDAFQAYSNAEDVGEAVWKKLGRVYVRLEEYETAFAVYEEGNVSAEVWIKLGKTCIKKKEYSFSFDAYLQAGEDVDGITWKHLGNACLRDGKGVRALEAYVYAEGSDPIDCIEAIDWYNLGITLYSRPLREFAFRRVITINPKHSEAWRELANTLLYQDKYTEAVDANRRSIKLDKLNPQAWSGLGKALSKLEEDKEAFSAYKRAFKLGLEDEEVQVNLNNLKRKLKLQKEGVKTFGVFQEESKQEEVIRRSINENPLRYFIFFSSAAIALIVILLNNPNTFLVLWIMTIYLGFIFTYLGVSWEVKHDHDRWFGTSKKDLRWPTRSLESAVEKMSGREECKIMYPLPKEYIDVTGDCMDQILDFAPDLRMLGLDLYIERNFPGRYGTWGGVFVRALHYELEDYTAMRCLQYLFIYTRQLGAIDFFWSVLTPTLMSLWGIVFYYLEWWVPVIVFSPLLILAVSSSMGDPISRFRLQGRTLLAIFWIIEWTGIGSLSAPSILLLCAAVIFLVIMLLDRLEITPTGHPMDYIPVFVWIKRADSKTPDEDCVMRWRFLTDKPKWTEYEKWTFHSASWDTYHYKVGRISRDREENTTELVDRYLLDNRRVRLLIDNQWHSIRLGNWLIENPDVRVIARAIAFCFILASPIIYLGPWALSILTDLWWVGYVVCPLLLVVFLCFLSLGPYDLIPDIGKLQDDFVYESWRVNVRRSLGVSPFLKICEDMDDDTLNRYLKWLYRTDRIDIPTKVTEETWKSWQKETGIWFLNDKVLVKFWNLEKDGRSSDDPRLVVVFKMQKPSTDGPPFTDFRDTLPELYDEIERLATLVKKDWKSSY